jgi:predicted metal-dependent phosphoesterase TrpH
VLRVDLHHHSNFPHDGSSSLLQLIDRARECTLDRLGLTDRHVVTAASGTGRRA